MKQIKLLLTLLISLVMGTNAWAADLVVDEYMSTFNGQYSYNVLMTNENVWHWTTATTPIDNSNVSYPSWGGSKSLYPFAVTSSESVAEGSVLITLDCSFKRYSSYYSKCRVEVLVGGKSLYCQYDRDERYYYNYADIETSDNNPVDKMLTFVSFGEVSGEVVVRVNNYSVSGAYNGTFSLRSVNVKRAKLVAPTVVSDQPNPAEAPFTLTVTNNDPDAELYWKGNNYNPYEFGSAPTAIESGFTKTYDNNSQNSFYAFTKRDGFYSAFVGGIYVKKVVRNIQFSEESGHYFLNTTLPSSVTITCDDLKEGDQLFYKKGLDEDWTTISSGTSIEISADDADNYNYYFKVAIYAKVVNASGMESEVKNLYLPIASVYDLDVAFNGWSNSNNKYQLEFDGPQLLTLGFSGNPVEGLALEYSYDGETWSRYNANNKPVISSSKMIFGRVVYSSNGDVVRSGRYMNYIINPAQLSGTCTYNYYSDMPFDITIGSTSFVNTYVAYTTDGSDPRTSSTAVQVSDEEQTVHIAESCTLKMAINQAGTWNDVVEKTMSIQLNQPFSFKQPQYVPDYNDGRSLDAEYWLLNEVGLSCRNNPYYQVFYDNGNVGSWSISSTGYGFFEVKSGLGECTYTVSGDVNDNRYITHMVVTSLESWSAHDNIDFNGQTVFTTYEANGSSLQTDANGQKYLLLPQGATITVSAPEGINLLGVFLNGGNNEENISHLRQTVEGCYVSHVPVNDWFCKWIGRSHSVTFVADAEQRIYGIESFYYLTPSGIEVYFENDEVTVGETMPAPYVYNPNNLPITYSSSDTDIATVDAETGVVTAVAPGWCTITAEFAGDGFYAPFKENYQIRVVPDVSTINFMGQELKNAQETLTGEIGGGTWTFTWEEEEVQENEGDYYDKAPRRSAPRRNLNGTTIVQIPVLTLNNVTITSQGPIIEVNDYREFRLRLIGENSLTSTQAPAIALGTYNGANSHGASMLITDEDGVWETESSGGYNPGVAAPQKGRRKTNGTNGPAKLTISGGPVGIGVCNGSLFIADCEVEASGIGYGVYFMDYSEQEGGISGGEANAPRREAPKKVLPTSYWSYYFQTNDNAKLKLQGGEAALYGWFCERDLNVNITPELKACDLSLDDVRFNSYWDDGYYFYSYMVYDNASNAYNYAKSLQFYNDYFTVNTIEGIKMKFWPIDEDEMTCRVGDFNEQSGPIIAIDRNTTGSVTIPSEANGYQVKSISSGAFYDCNYISSVSIPASVESIGEMAFGDCDILSQVTCLAELPPTLHTVQEDGEARITSFTDIDKGAILYVPAGSMTAYENSAWNNCFCEIRPIGGKDFIFAAKTKEGVTMTFQVLDADEKIAQVYGYYYYDNSDFGPAVSQSTQGSVTVPAQVQCSDNGKTYSVIAISDRAFGGCSNLTSVVLSEGIQYIGYGAFYNCYEMTSLVIPSSVNYIDGYALQYCGNLESVTIYAEDPDDIELADAAFYDMYRKPTLYVPEGYADAYSGTIWSNYFYISEFVPTFTEIVEGGVPMTFKITGDGTVQTYGYYYWDNNDNFVAVPAIPSNYSGSLTIPETVTHGGVIYTVTAIGDYSFEAEELPLNLTEVTIPSTITYIGDYAFDGHMNMTSVTCYAEEPPSISEDAFYVAPTTTLYVPTVDAVSSYQESDWSYFFNKIRVIGDTSFGVGDTFVANNAQGVPITYRVTSAEEGNYKVQTYGYWASGYAVTAVSSDFSGHLTIPETAEHDDVTYTVTGISEESFDADGLPLNITGVTIPNTVTEIGAYAFWGNAITELLIPNSVEAIEYYVFSNCSIETLTLGSGLTEISSQVFAGCPLQSVYVNKTVPIELPIDSWTDSEETHTYYVFDPLEDGQTRVLYVPAGCVEAYQASDWWTQGGFSSIEEMGGAPATVPVTIGQYEMATFCSTQPLNFTNVAGLKAYIVSGFNPDDNNLTLTRVYGVPAGTGLVLYGNAGEYDIPVEATNSSYANMLVGCTEDVVIQPTSTVTITENNVSTEITYTNFVLSVKDNQPGFYRFNLGSTSGRTIEAGKAYLRIKSSDLNQANVKGFKLIFGDDEDDPTAIGLIDEDSTKNGEIFNLGGQRLNKLQKGVNIINGKKVLVK